MTISIALMALGLVSHLAQSARARETGPGIITGVVVNEKHQPAGRVTVYAFSAVATPAGTMPRERVPYSTRASGTASTDSQGRFRITGLEPGEYLIGAEAPPLPAHDTPDQPPVYAITFYPSTIDHRAAVRVSARPSEGTPVQVQLVRVKGARLTGSVVSPSGRSTTGMQVRLFHSFGGHGSGYPGALVGPTGTFEIRRLPPGWVRVTIEPPSTAPTDGATEFATRLIEVPDGDVDGLSFVLGTGASIAGRIVAEPGADIPSPVGLRVNASPPPEEYTTPGGRDATAAPDWSFRMSGLSGSYQFEVMAERAPFVKATRVVVDGVEAPAGNGVELTDGLHDVVVFVARRAAPASTVDKTLSSAALVERFTSEKYFGRQFELGKEIADRGDAGVLSLLVDSLADHDRHVRGNVAFIFARLGDARGFEAITSILTDRSDRPEGQGIATASSDGRYRPARQIAADRHYAAHLLGDLRDPRGVAILVPLLKDPEVNSTVPWALEQIGGKQAIDALIDALDEDSPSLRVQAIYALEGLNAKEALPRLVSLLDDNRRTNFGAQVSVADAARAAIARLR